MEEEGEGRIEERERAKGTGSRGRRKGKSYHFTLALSLSPLSTILQTVGPCEPTSQASKPGSDVGTPVKSLLFPCYERKGKGGRREEEAEKPSFGSSFFQVLAPSLEERQEGRKET